MALKTREQILDNIVLIQMDVHIWTARKKLRKDDLSGVEDEKLPPSQVASLGSKKVIDLDLLAPFNKLKREAVKLCERRGVRFLGSYAVSIKVAEEIAKKLDDLKAEFEAEKAKFLAGYDKAVQDWLGKNTKWAHALRDYIVDRSVVDAGLSFNWHAIQVRSDSTCTVAQSATSVAVDGLQGKIFSEIAEEAQDIIASVFHGKDRVTQKALIRVRRIHDKLHDLSILSLQAEPLADTVAYVLGQMPKDGVICELNYQVLYGLLSLLSDPQKAQDHGNRILGGVTTAQAVSDELTPAVLAAEAQSEDQSPTAELPAQAETQPTSETSKAPATASQPPQNQVTGVNTSSPETLEDLCLF